MGPAGAYRCQPAAKVATAHQAGATTASPVVNEALIGCTHSTVWHASNKLRGLIVTKPSNSDRSVGWLH